MKSKRSDIQLLTPDIGRDAAFAHSWFTRPEGRITLLSMGNAESEIQELRLEDHERIIKEFLELEKEGKQITRAVVVDGKTIGIIWIELFENHGVKAPSIHIMIGDPDHRGQGIGRVVMESAIHYAWDVLHYDTVYTRHLANNVPMAKLGKSLGFVKDGKEYEDQNGLVWQNITKNHHDIDFGNPHVGRQSNT